MPEPVKEIPLTQEEENAIWAAINNNPPGDDEDPGVIIDRDYNGNTDAYLRNMAGWHNIPIGSKTPETINLQ